MADSDSMTEWTASAVEVDWMLGTPGEAFERPVMMRRLADAMGTFSPEKLEAVRTLYWSLWTARQRITGR